MTSSQLSWFQLFTHLRAPFHEIALLNFPRRCFLHAFSYRACRTVFSNFFCASRYPRPPSRLRFINDPMTTITTRPLLCSLASQTSRSRMMSLETTLGNTTCSKGHVHPPWNTTGVLRIAKCESVCGFCQKETKTAANLRKVSDATSNEEYSVS